MTDSLPLVVVAPDSFKGSCDSVAAASALARGVRQALGETVRIRELPLADGGEGTLDALTTAWGGTVRTAPTTDALGRPRDGRFGLSADGRTAIIEAAEANGLPHVSDVAPQPLGADTRGVGLLALAALGAQVRVVAPPTLMPGHVDYMGATAYTNFDAALDGADVVMMLRLQNERMDGAFIPSPREYHALYGLTPERLALAKPDALVMHPGPMNRGVEITSSVADDVTHSAITEQVEMGVAVRMACLDVLTRTSRNVEGWA